MFRIHTSPHSPLGTQGIRRGAPSSSHTRQATLHNTAHHTSGGDDDPVLLAHLPHRTYHHMAHTTRRSSSHTRSSMGERSSSRTQLTTMRKTVERGYGPAHKRLRNRLKPTVAQGNTICWRCGNTIQPGQPWDLGHDDNDRTQYRGPEHRQCNRGEPSRRKRQPPPHTRQW